MARRRSAPDPNPHLLAAANAISAQALAETPDHYIRFSELTDPGKLDILFRAASAGMNITSACEAAGIHPSTWQGWLKRADEQPDSAYAAFSTEIKRRRREGQIKLLGRIDKASESPQYWTAAAWTLERTDPEQFALRKDDNSVPKVIVQIGAKDSDIRVQINQVEPA